MNESSLHPTTPTSPLVRIGVALLFLLIAAGAIIFSAREYERTHQPGWDDKLQAPSDKPSGSDAETNSRQKGPSEAQKNN